MKSPEERKHHWIDPNLSPAQYDRAVFERLLANTVFNDNGCWIWQGFVKDGPSAYGEMSYRGETWRVHRLSFKLTRGSIPEGLEVCHTCDTMACCNPGHLEVKTHQANLMDASRRKRLQGQGKTHCLRGHPLEGDNLSPHTPFRSCRICTRGRYRLRLGWPEHLAFSDIKVPKGYKLDRQTGQIVSANPRGSVSNSKPPHS